VREKERKWKERERERERGIEHATEKPTRLRHHLVHHLFIWCGFLRRCRHVELLRSLHPLLGPVLIKVTVVERGRGKGREVRHPLLVIGGRNNLSEVFFGWER